MPVTTTAGVLVITGAVVGGIEVAGTDVDGTEVACGGGVFVAIRGVGVKVGVFKQVPVTPSVTLFKIMVL